MPRSPALPPRCATVLVADDDDDMRALVATALRSDGYHVVEARDGDDLLLRLVRGVDGTAGAPDLVVADVMMPRLSGLGVLGALHRARLRCPVILMTVLQDESVSTVAKRLGAVCVFHKPFDVDDLRTAVVNACLAPGRCAR